MSKVLWLEDISLENISKVGEKSSRLGELESDLQAPVLQGFSTTSNAYREFLTETELKPRIEQYLEQINTEELTEVHRKSEKIRSHIRETDIPRNLREKILDSYKELDGPVAVRGSLIESEEALEDMLGRFLNINSEEELLDAIRDIFASYFTERAIVYREENEIDHFESEITILVQESGGDKASGEAFSYDPESSFENVVTVNSIYGTGGQTLEKVEADQYTVFKENFGIIEKQLGSKKLRKTVEENGELEERKVPMNDRQGFAITKNQAKELAKHTSRIQDHFESHVELEWVLDNHNTLHIVEVRPKQIENGETVENYILEERSDVLLEGEAVGSKIGSGAVHILDTPSQIESFEEGDILVTDTTSPEWEALMERASAVITNKGGRSSHTSEYCRELGIPAIINTEKATSVLTEGEKVTVDCLEGNIWKEELQYTWEEHDLSELPKPETSINLNIQTAEEAFKSSNIPVERANTRLGSLILSEFDKHPLKMIEEDEEEYVERLKSAIGKVAAGFHPGKVVLRLNDLTTEQFQQFKGFEEFEDDDKNPELGFRGSSRLYNSQFSKMFEKDCEAIRRCIDELELDNITVSVPFCRNIEEANNVRAKMKEYGLDQGDLDVYLTIETPGNVVRAEEFSKIFDGFSVDLDSLTGLTLGVDQDSRQLNDYFDERDPAVKETVKNLIRRAELTQTDVGIVSESVVEHQRYLEFLIDEGADWITTNPQKALRTMWEIDEIEKAEAEDVGYEFDIEGMVGTPAGHVHDALKAHGTATAQKLHSLTPDKLDSETVHQALGWLANEGKISVENQGGKVMYGLK